MADGFKDFFEDLLMEKFKSDFLLASMKLIANFKNPYSNPL
jgi:hypothetical protein